MSKISKLLLAICLPVFLCCSVAFLYGCGHLDAKSDSSQAKTVNVGETITLSNGLEITVLSVQPGFKTYDGKSVCKATVKYVNNSKEDQSYGSTDWKAQDANGVQSDNEIMIDNSASASELTMFGTLAKGGTVTGDVYFTYPITKLLYGSLYGTEAAWNVS